MLGQTNTNLKFIGKNFVYLFLGIVTISVIFPVFYCLMASFQSTRSILSEARLIPENFVWQNYSRAFVEANFTRYTFNSVFISTGCTVGNLLNSCIVGFCLARSKMVGKKLIKWVILTFMFISLGPMTLFPQIRVVLSLGIYRSIWSIILPGLGGLSMQALVFEAYFKGQGMEIDEAAVIDGCGFFGRFFKIGLPLSKPLLGTFAVINFNGSWNNFFWPYVLTFTNQKIQPLIVAVISLRDRLGEAATEWGLLLAGSTIAIIPVLILYIFTSKWIIKGVTEGSIKF